MNLSTRVYGLLLLAYPPEFRREFGSQMLQVFRDSYRAEALNGSVPSFWLRTLIDLVSTAAKERIDNTGREGVFMNRRSDAVALLGCAAIIVIAFLLHRYVTKNNTSIILIAYVLDPLIVTGVIGNFIVFLLTKTTKLNPLRTAITVFAVVHAACLLLIVVLSSIGPPVNWAGILIGYVLSFVIWVGLHFAWRTTGGSQALNTEH
jgi:hypothetical protein